MDGDIRDVLEKSVIYDRGVVTFKWLTWKLGVHPNVAKEHLQRFINEQEVDGSNVAGHSIVTGVKNKVYRVVLTPRKQVEEAKKSLTSVTGVHVYSAQPANLEDVEAKLLDAATKCQHSEASPIRCDAALETRSSAKRPPAAAKVGPSSTAGKTSVQGSTQLVTAKKEESPPTSKPIKTTKPGAASKSSKGKGKQNELAAMFSKARAAPASAKAASTSSGKPASSEKGKEPGKDPKSSPAGKAKVAREPEDVAPNSITPKKEGKPEVQESPESLVRSKRVSKRKVISDSEEEEDTPNQTASSSGPIQSSDRTDGSTGDSKKSSGDPKERSKKRRRVMKSVQQTFKDEDGYLVTKTVKQMVSESDEEEEDPIPKTVREQAKRANPSKKQQSLLSFFGKRPPQ
ncbi:DNA polymerase delta subunit 3 [Ixodes scapularis]